MVVEGIHALTLITSVERIVGDRRNTSSTSGLRVSVCSTSTNTSDAENDANYNTNNRSSREDSGNSNNRNSAALDFSVRASTVLTEVKLALILSTIAAVHWETEATTEWVADIIRAQIVVSASNGRVDTAKSWVTGIICADTLIIAEISRHRSVRASRSNIALINGALIVVVASTSNVLPSAS
jgi:hypothetical protein